jgi:hypothetical protein
MGAMIRRYDMQMAIRRSEYDMKRQEEEADVKNMEKRLALQKDEIAIEREKADVSARNMERQLVLQREDGLATERRLALQRDEIAMRMQEADANARNMERQLALKKEDELATERQLALQREVLNAKREEATVEGAAREKDIEAKKELLALEDRAREGLRRSVEYRASVGLGPAEKVPIPVPQFTASADKVTIHDWMGITHKPPMMPDDVRVLGCIASRMYSNSHGGQTPDKRGFGYQMTTTYTNVYSVEDDGEMLEAAYHEMIEIIARRESAAAPRTVPYVPMPNANSTIYVVVPPNQQ